MELLQVFDDDKIMLNEWIERDKKKELPSGKNFMIILLFIQNNNGDFLIQKVSKNKGGEYATTGGHVTFGDNNIDTVIKESSEELGIKLTADEFVLVSSNKVNCCFVDTFYCKKDIDISNMNLQIEEVESVCWLSINEIENLIEQNKFRKGNIEPFKNLINYLENKKTF